MRLAFAAFFAGALFAVPSLSGAAERSGASGSLQARSTRLSWPLAVSVPVMVSASSSYALPKLPLTCWLSPGLLSPLTLGSVTTNVPLMRSRGGASYSGTLNLNMRATKRGLSRPPRTGNYIYCHLGAPGDWVGVDQVYLVIPKWKGVPPKLIMPLLSQKLPD